MAALTCENQEGTIKRSGVARHGARREREWADNIGALVASPNNYVKCFFRGQRDGKPSVLFARL